MTENNMQMKPYPLGAHCEGDGIRFSFVSAKEDCGIILYDKKTGKQLERKAFRAGNRIGNVYCEYITDYKPEDITYHFYEEDKLIPDQNAVIFYGKSDYGKERESADLKAGFLADDFDWQQDQNPKVPYRDCIAYLLHVRGFTQHVSSKVKDRGTYRGIMEKIPYLKEIGITTVELQPAYEFLEIPSKEERRKEMPYLMKEEDLDAYSAPKLNYWGYKKGFYYAPKASYAVEDAATEFKELVREFHKNGMEIVMQFYFPKEVSVMEIPEILRYWVLEYHVDGFHLMGENLPVEMLVSDPVLAYTKLWYYDFATDAIYQRDEQPSYCNLAAYQDDYLYAMRKFLKGDEDTVKSVLYQMRHIPEKSGRIHYMSNYYGMTLMDMVSYDRKHNEENGESNKDGNDYNCSWNCGEEGVTRKRKVTALRLRQLKNAFCMLLLSQSTPLIFMGDEFGNSQKGNNNPYCQDNEITWLDWKDVDRNKAILAFWKELVAIRKAHPVLHLDREPRIMDYIACGYPDLSYHGETAWRPQTESYSRCLGMMYCGKYAKVDRRKDDDFIYIAMNMHWENHEFGLPKLPKGMKWEVLVTTEDMQDKNSAVTDIKTEVESIKSADYEKLVEAGCMVSARSIVVFRSVQEGEIKAAVKYADKTSF